MIKGSKMSEEAKRKLSESHRGQIPWIKGKHHLKAAKKKISIATKGKNNPMFGRLHSEETKKKMSKAWQKRVVSEETKKKMSRAFKGRRLKPHTEEHRRNLSKSRKGKYIGKNNSNWRGGTSFLPYPPIFNNELKKFIKDRDNNECQNPFCDHQSKELLNVHHIDYDKNNCSQFNLIALCVSCNGKANVRRRHWKRLYKKIIWSKYA